VSCAARTPKEVLRAARDRSVGEGGNMSDSIRIWKRQAPGLLGGAGYREWHVSIGDSHTYRDLRRHLIDAGEDADSLRSDQGCCWDEALQTVVFAVVCPAALYTQARYLEPPDGGGWELAVEIGPSPPLYGRGYFDVSAPIGVGATLRCWPTLTVGEALATFCMLTFPREWRGFTSKEVPARALVAVAAANGDDLINEILCEQQFSPLKTQEMR